MIEQSCGLQPKNLDKIRIDVSKVFLKTIKEDSPKLLFITNLQEYLSKYKDYSEEDKLIIVNTVYDYATKLRGLINLYGNSDFISITDLKTMVNGVTVSNPEPEELRHKLDELSGDHEQVTDTMSTFDKMYGASNPKLQILQEIHSKIIDFCLIDRANLVEVLTDEEANLKIKLYQNELFAKVVHYLATKLNHPEWKDLVMFSNGNYTGALDTINKALELYLETKYKPDVLQSIYEATLNPRPSVRREALEELQFLNSLAILNNFDLLLSNELNNSVKIRYGLNGVHSSRNDKYIFNLYNHNMTHSFRDDDEDVDGFAETSDVVKRILQMPLYDGNGNILKGMQVNPQNVGLLNGLIKESVYLTDEEIVISEYITDAYGNLVENPLYKPYQQEGVDVSGKTWRQLITEATIYNVDGYRNLYWALNNLKYNGIQWDVSKKRIVESVYKTIFEKGDGTSGSLFNIHVNTQKQIQKNGTVIENLPRNYYAYIVQYLATQEITPQGSYENTESELGSKTLSERMEGTKTYFIDQMLDGVFNVKGNHTFETFSVKRSDWGNDVNPTLEITVDGYTITTGKNTKLLIKNDKGQIIKIDETNIYDFANLIKEVLDIDIKQAGYLNTLMDINGKDSLDKLIKMVSDIIYTYEVSKYLYSELEAKNIENEKDYKNRLNYFYEESKIPKVSKSTPQLKYINKEDTSLKIAIATTREVLNNLVFGNIIKDGEGKAMSLVGLSLLATRLEQQTARNRITGLGVQKETPTLAAVNSFTANRVFKGVEFSREYSGNGVTKKVTKFSAAEHFYSQFVIDYLLEMAGNAQVVKFLPSIISDKSKILKTKMDFTQPVEVVDSKGKRVLNDDGSYKVKTIKDLNLEEILNLYKKELGDYYTSIYYDTLNTYTKLSNITGFTFDLDSNFQTFNLQVLEAVLEKDQELLIALNEFNEGINYLKQQLELTTNEVEKVLLQNLLEIHTKQQSKLLKQLNKAKELYIKDLLHNAILEDSSIKLTEVLHYSMRDGELKGNALLFDQLYRWECLDAYIEEATPIVTDDVFKAYKLETGYGTSENFIQAKQLEFISALINLESEISYYDESFNELTGKGLGTLKKNTTFTQGENVVFGILHYQVFDKNGKLLDKSLKITDQDSILDSSIYKELQKRVKFPAYQTVREYINPESPDFNIGKLVEAINILNTSKASVTTAYNSAVKAVFKSETVKKSDQARKEIKKLIENSFGFKEGSELYLEIYDLYFSEDAVESVLNGSELELTNNKEFDLVIKLWEKAIQKYQDKYENIADYKPASIEIHPELLKYQAYDYWMSLEYMNMSVGTHLNHPPSGKTLIEQESKAWANQVKRNVSLTAAKHSFTLNLIEGIRSTYRIAVIEDDTDDVATIYGDTDEVKYTDGATYCSIVTNYLENNSLKGDAVGVNKKQFVHDWLNGTGVIIKTAGFAITNDTIRRSKYQERMNKKMLSLIAGDNIDITKDYNGNDINYGPIYYEENGVIHKVTSIQYGADGTTITRMKLVDGVWVDAGSKTKKLQSNYDIWKEVFGGEYSLTLKSGKDSTNSDNYVLSENSAKQLVHAVNYVGTKKKGVSTALWQSDVDLPLKKALIDYVVTGGAIKLGATNVNSKEAYTDDNYQLTTMEINTHDAGVQLDAEHHADESVLSLMTLVVNALNARGYSTVKANAVYKALEGLVEDALGDYLSKNSDVVNLFISKVIVKALASNDVLQEGDLMGALLNTISDMYKEGSITSLEVLDSFPFDHPLILNNAVSKISSFLTSSAIKIKFPGSMSVLCPSNKIYKLFRDSLSDLYKDLVHFKGNVDNLGFGDPIKIGQIELGKTYIINGVKMKINTPSDYYELYDLLPAFEGMPYPEIREDYSEGRDLAAYNITFTDSTGEVYNMWDLDAIRTMFTVNKNDRPQFLELLQETLNTIKNGGTVKVRGLEITIVGEPVIHPYELICGYMYKTAFGLQEGDNVGQILSDPNFFVKRSLENFTSKILDKEFHVELKKVNGEHLYLVDSNGSIPSGLTKLKIEKRQIGDEVYRIDEHGSKMYSLSSMQDTVYVDKNGNQIIATKNIDYYIDKHLFVNMRLSSSIKPSTIETLTKLEHKVVRKCLKALSPDLNVETIKESIPAHTKKLEKDIESLKEQLLKNKTLSSENEALLALIDSGNEVFASFLKSLEVLAARIPAQCHQSFMAMKIVGFDLSGLNNAYVNRMLLYLLGSDYDIDKVSLLGFKFKSGKFVKWSPFMNLSSLELLKASENIPFPTAKELVITEEYDSIWDLLILSIEQTGLLTVEDYVEHNFSTVDLINLFATILDVVNESGLPEAVAESVYGKKLLNLINSHNKYLSRKGVDLKAALINFASTYMYNTSRDPKNLILGQTSVDTPTKAVKKPAELQPMSRRSKLFGPGNPVSKIEQMILTLGGKENTSIVASALKVFEAISHSYYTALQTNDHTDRLFIGKEILGKNITLVANAYSLEHPEHSEMIKLALEQVDNITDAFVLFSALLSLSTDNAKDPTLTKINASPNMMPLYLAGLALGLDLTTLLIPLMTSDLAWKISSLMNSNVFVGNLGLFDVKAVINYIDNGPLEAYKALPIVVKQLIQNSLVYYIESRTGEKLELTRDDQVVRELIKYPSFDLEGVLYRLSKGKKADLKTEEEREEILLKSIKKEAKKILKSRLASLRNLITKVKSQIVEDESTLVNKRAITKNEKLKDKLNLLQQLQLTLLDLYDHLKHNKVSDKVSQSLTEDYNQLIDSVSNMVSLQVSKGYKEILSYESNPTEAKKIRLQLRRFLKELRKYKRVKQLAFEIIIINGEEHMVLPLLRKLQDMASEMSKTRSLVALNKGLPNSVPKLIKFIRDFESILGDVTEPDDIEGFAGRNQEWVGELTNIVDLKLFVTNVDYRNFVIDEYEKVKKFINPFNVINYNPHYMGYLKAASILKDLLFGTSRIIEVTDEISKNILNKYVRSTGESQKHIKKIQKFVVSRLNNYFMRANAKLTINPKEKFTKDGKIIPNDSEFTLMLGTPEANATFKYWMENEVIPTLKKQMYANRLIRDMLKMESSNTIDGNGIVSYALRFTNFPKTEEELRTFKEYKRSLKRLGSETYKRYSVLDLLFYYNLITFNGENLTGSFSALFEDIILDKSNSVINAFSLFYSQFGKLGQFKLGEDYTEDEILRFIAPTISVSGLSSNKLPYARVYNTNTMEYVLVKKVPEEIYSNNDPNIPTEAEMETGSSTNLFEAKLAQAYYEELDSQYSGLYFTYNYTTSNEDVIPISGTIKYNKVSLIITINKKDYSLLELAKIAKDNGHLDVKESDIILELQLILDGEVITTIDTLITKNNIEEILKQKEC